MDARTLPSKRISPSLVNIVLFILIFTAGCKNNSGISEVEIPPSVTVTYPAHNAVDIPVNLTISALFSEDMDPATITDSSFTLKMDTLTIDGSINYSDSTATFSPSSELDFESTYTVTITTGAQNLSGNSMDRDYAWTFTTASEQDDTVADTTPPEITATNPSNNANGVSINTSIIASFNEPINGSTINEATFFLMQGDTPISANVSYANTTATLNPANSLSFGNTYTATVTSAIEDTAGNTLSEDVSWSFSTGDEPDNSAPQVTSIQPENNADDVAIGSNITVTFNEPINTSTITNGSFFLEQGNSQIPGEHSFSGNSVTFNPDDDLSFDETYTATVTTDIEDLAGNNLSSDVEWSFTTNSQPDDEAPEVVSIEPDDNENNVPINTNITVTFTEAINESSVDNSTFLVEQGNTQIPGFINVSNNVVTFNPVLNLQYETDYTVTITEGVEDQAGNGLEEDFESEFETEEEPDDDDPEVDSTDPTDNAANVPINISTISVTFNEEVNPQTVNENSFFLSQNGIQVSGTVPNFTGETASFIPNEELIPNTTYTATVTSDVEDLAGNTLGNDYDWEFTTEQESNPPVVNATNPVENATDIAIDIGAITVTFNEPMNSATFDENSFSLTQGATSVSGSVPNFTGSQASYIPDEELQPSTIYTVTISTDVEDLAGNNLENPYTWTFTTEEESEPPTVDSMDPEAGASNVPLNQIISANFSEALNPSTVNGTTVTLALDGNVDVAGQVSYSDEPAVITFTPSAILMPGSNYTMTISTGVQDLVGNALVNEVSWSFTTAEITLVIDLTN